MNIQKIQLSQSEAFSILKSYAQNVPFEWEIKALDNENEIILNSILKLI